MQEMLSLFFSNLLHSKLKISFPGDRKKELFLISDRKPKSRRVLNKALKGVV